MKIVFPRGDQHTMRSHGAGTPTPLTTIFSPGRHDEPPQLSRPLAILLRAPKNPPSNR
jgi:hypothetical protein